uniref:(northern house mosquito) hypothetical protein n=1 Tax=Culex pipiens TaxID=7175 RepID=A0A8D8HPZ2_CULPI
MVGGTVNLAATKGDIANKLWAIPECGSKECNYGLDHSFQVKELGLCPRRICSKTQTSLKYHNYLLRQGYFRRQKFKAEDNDFETGSGHAGQRNRQTAHEPIKPNLGKTGCVYLFVPRK